MISNSSSPVRAPSLSFFGNIEFLMNKLLPFIGTKFILWVELKGLLLVVGLAPYFVFNIAVLLNIFILLA